MKCGLATVYGKNENYQLTTLVQWLKSLDPAVEILEDFSHAVATYWMLGVVFKCTDEAWKTIRAEAESAGDFPLDTLGAAIPLDTPSRKNPLYGCKISVVPEPVAEDRLLVNSMQSARLLFVRLNSPIKTTGLDDAAIRRELTTIFLRHGFFVRQHASYRRAAYGENSAGNSPVYEGRFVLIADPERNRDVNVQELVGALERVPCYGIDVRLVAKSTKR